MCERAGAPVPRGPPADGLRDHDVELSDQRDHHLDALVHADGDWGRDVREQHGQVADARGPVVDERSGCAVWEVGRGIQDCGDEGGAVGGLGGGCVLDW
jgi:hypothetical protein